jgi:hypothetical protein
VARNVRLINDAPNDFWHRWINVATLRDLLATLPDDVNVAVSPVGELALLRNGTADDAGEYIGHLNIGSEEIILSE